MPDRRAAEVSAKPSYTGRECDEILKVLKEENDPVNQKILSLAKSFLKMMGN